MIGIALEIKQEIADILASVNENIQKEYLSSVIFQKFCYLSKLS